MSYSSLHKSLSKTETEAEQKMLPKEKSTNRFLLTASHPTSAYLFYLFFVALLVNGYKISSQVFVLHSRFMPFLFGAWTTWVDPIQSKQGF